MDRFTFWRRWLLAGTGLLVAFGLAMVFLAGTPAFDPLHHRIDPAFWGDTAPPAAARAFARWAYGAWGATIAGWGVFILAMTAGPFSARERWARNTMAAGLAVWYVLDTGVSLRCGVGFNAALNTALLVMLGLPLACTWRSFPPR